MAPQAHGRQLALITVRPDSLPSCASSAPREEVDAIAEATAGRRRTRPMCRWSRLGASRSEIVLVAWAVAVVVLFLLQPSTIDILLAAASLLGGGG